MLADNYAWLLIDDASRSCAVVDPSEAGPVRSAIEDLGLSLCSILATHHHWDHTGGIEGLVQHYPKVEVYCSSYDFEHRRVPCATQGFAEEACFSLWDDEVRCISVPGHTLGAVAFYLPEQRAVFTGDTLFTAGCGRLFEGNPTMMWNSLLKLRDLPDETLVYCGHEYTEKNLRFAQSLELDNSAVEQRLRDVTSARAAGKPTVPSRLDLEKATNPFLRADTEALLAHVEGAGPAEVFGALRARRDVF
ncbi:MAG: hydroxyacylglutathione hydrolase [Myxococcota bacterium]